ncbi:MAG: hypothetical protein D6732_26130 [Methanobacteriota archaeon]|nr:MAG: hypothetical protein D6732_26130 [Euryarchaeota archaeon]
MEQIIPANGEAIANTDQVVLNRPFITASAYYSVFAFLALLVNFILLVNEIGLPFVAGKSSDDQTVMILGFLMSNFISDVIFGDYKIRIREKEVPLNTLKLFWNLRMWNGLDKPSLETLLFVSNGLSKLLALIAFVLGSYLISGALLVLAGMLRTILYLAAQNRVKNELPKTYTFMLFMLSSIIESTFGVVLIVYEEVLSIQGNYLIFLYYVLGSVSLLGIQMVIRWTEKNKIAQARYRAMENNLRDTLTTKDPTFGNVVAELPSTLFRISVLQKSILFSAILLAVIIYVLILIFLNLGIDPFADPIQFLFWSLPLVISALAVLFIISRTEEASFRTNLLFSHLEKALESFEKTNEKYLSILEGE